MADVNEYYQLLSYIINKNQQGNLTPAKFNLVINQGQRSYVSFYLGIPQNYEPGRPISKVELGNNAIVRKRLTPVILETTLTIDVNGNSNYPANYLQSDAMWTSTAFKKVRIVEQNRLSSFYNSTIDPILTNPIYVLKTTKLQFYPITLGSSIISYVSNPPDIIWGSIPDANGRPIYNVGTSTQPVFDIVSMYDIIARALLIIGINLQSQQVVSYANEIKDKGQ